MPEFVFHVIDSKEPRPQPIRVELENPDEARKEAIAVIAGLAKDALPDGNHHAFTAIVDDATGTSIFKAVLALEAKWLVEV